VIEPKHGEVWQSIAKDPANVNKSTEEILYMVADALKAPE
jgi:pre-mRNA-processing factor 6